MDVGNATIIAAAIAAAVSLGSSVFAWCAANKSNKAAAQSNEVTNRTNREIAVFEQDEVEQKEEVKKALAAGVPKATILTYFYPEVSVERMSSYRKKH